MRDGRATRFAAIGLAIGVLVGSSLGSGIGALIGLATGNLPLWMGVCTYAGCVAGTTIAMSIAARKARRGADECPECGYRIRGLPSKLCPECGMDYEALRREAEEAEAKRSR